MADVNSGCSGPKGTGTGSVLLTTKAPGGNDEEDGDGATAASGVLATMLVCMAVRMAMGATSLSAPAIALAASVTVFVAAGLAHNLVFSTVGRGRRGGARPVVSREEKTTDRPKAFAK